ncbi:MAG TPA: UMP kinase [Armatimonadota bacterium]|nr:UMP kinase [Armatimonadota bacterium]
MSQSPRYSRVLLKLSGEALAGEKGYGIDPDVVAEMATQLKEIHDHGVEIGVVVGGGNIFRARTGTKNAGIERTTADYMGMMASVLNALALQDAMEKVDIQTRVLSAIEMREVAEPYIRRRAVRHLEKGRVVIFAAGTGNPYFTTDTAAALRAAEIGAQAIVKATNVAGVYDRDPKKDANAKLLTRLTYMDALKMGLKVMDATAISLSMENRIPLLVLNMKEDGNLLKAVLGEAVGSTIESDITEE